MSDQAETRYQRVAREQRERQAARLERALAQAKAERRARRRPRPYTWDTKTANHIDGFGRDDLGESRDY